MTDEQQLVALCKSGRMDAFGELVRRHQSRLFTQVSRILPNEEDARDVVQSTFLLAYQALDRFEGRSDFSTWLYRIGVNTAFTFKRKQRPLASIDASRGGAGMDCPDRSRGSEPAAGLVCSEEATLVVKALGRLSTPDRTLLIMKDVDGLRYEELAAILRIPIGTVRSRLHRARLKLRGLLAREGMVDQGGR